MADDFDAGVKDPYSGAGEVTKNIVDNFRMADFCMKNWNLYGWYKSLQSVYLEINFKLTPVEIKECIELFKLIDPHKTSSYSLLIDFHIKLRFLCGKYKYFDMWDSSGKFDPKKAVYPGGR